MADRPKRAVLARLAVGLVALAFPLALVGAAQAAIAGAIPSTTTNRPDIRSATILTSTTVEVCYDKTLSSSYGGVLADFDLFGYRSDNISANPASAAVDPTSPDCVILTWPASGAGSVGDLTQYTGVQDLAGAVEANTGGAMSLEDAVALTGSTTHAGTTGVTTGPNLVGIATPTATNLTTDSLSFVFDKDVGPAPAADGFFFIDAAGNVCTSAAYLSGAGTTTVTVSFAGGSGCGTDTVADAVRGGAYVDAVNSASDLSSSNPNESVVLPGAPNGGATQRPDLVSAALSSNDDEIAFTFDKPVVLTTTLGGFFAEFSDASEGTYGLSSTGCTGSGTTTVTCSAEGQLAAIAEYAVAAWVNPGAVESSDNPTASGENTPGSAPIGDNAGAFARGFTTGPDVFAVAINHTSGVVTVNLDQRILGVTGSTDPINLLDSSGDVVAATGTPAFNSSAPPGPAVLTLTYPASALTNVTQVQFTQDAMFTPFDGGPGGDDVSMSQIVGATSSSAILKAYRVKAARKHAQKKHTKARSK